MTDSPHTAETAPSLAVFTRDGDTWLPGSLARGPWDPRAQHGGAPSALLAHIAESAMPEPGWQLARLSVELVRPVPIAPLTARHAVQPSRSTTRVTVDLHAGDTLVARAHGLLLRAQPLSLPAGLPGWSPAMLSPLPPNCEDRVRIPGLPDGEYFHRMAVESRVAHGDPARPGPAAAWFRLIVPLVQGAPTSPAMRVAAAADFGNGLSWILAPERYLFANADLSVHLHRLPVGEWVGLASETHADAGGAGMTLSRLYDEQGPIGVAVQTLVLRERSAAA
ncbi:thioesterase family protein [Variovorax sp. J22R24]|uniref:thioesterase family protein n=1 Tax=Variovorax gracilis TaxID=3053502 RepID=UPI002576DD25|nr:thioesterase family protein [Variovorax sp. J22R24]MDM0104587.1 thioesterase family protein [Variovorax sp. J22R24]